LFEHDLFGKSVPTFPDHAPANVCQPFIRHAAFEAKYGIMTNRSCVLVIDRFKPGDFMTVGMNEKRAAWFLPRLDRVMHPA
jgi:hypothetical protein